MISDVFSDAVARLDEYLTNGIYDDTYTGDLRERIILIRNEMEAVRIVLDRPPAPSRTDCSPVLELVES